MLRARPAGRQLAWVCVLRHYTFINTPNGNRVERWSRAPPRGKRVLPISAPSINGHSSIDIGVDIATKKKVASELDHLVASKVGGTTEDETPCPAWGYDGMGVPSKCVCLLRSLRTLFGVSMPSAAALTVRRPVLPGLGVVGELGGLTRVLRCPPRGPGFPSGSP